MVTISHLAKKYLADSFLLSEYLEEGLINYVALAEKIRPRIEKELGKKVKTSAVMMALRRNSENSRRKKEEMPSLKDSELVMKSNLCDIAVYKSPALFSKLKAIYELVDYNKGDTLNIVHGNYDVSIIINEKFEDKILKILDGEKILDAENNLVALTLKFGETFLYTPGITFSILKQLVLENINLIEIVSSLIEITFIINKKDATKGYLALQEFIEKS